MKKTLAAVAVLGAFAGSALAADVQLYGIVDTGIGYNHIDMDSPGEDDVDNFRMESGQASGSRFGFKGTEDLGNGMTVGFILEDGILSDTGVDDKVMFNRESSLFVQGNFGKFAMGRLGALNNGQSSWAKIGMISAFGTSDWGGFSAQLSNLMSLAGQWDNMIAYETPDFAGFKVYAQYGMGSDSNENESSSDRFYSLGVTYNNGPFAGYFAVDSINYKTAKFGSNDWTGNKDDIDDSLTVTLGGSYDFEVVKVYLGAQYFDEVKLSSVGGVVNKAGAADKIYKGTVDNKDVFFDTAYNAAIKIKGYGISLTADAPLAGGKAMFGVGYLDAESADSMDNAYASMPDLKDISNLDLKRYVVSVGYDYPFSKRTDVYAVASYMQDQVDADTKAGSVEWEPSAYSLYVGLRHRF